MSNPILQKKLFKAIENAHVMRIKHLVNLGADVNLANINGETPLAVACYEIEENELEQVILYLLEKGADINKYEGKGFTPLFYAVLANRPAVVQSLLEKGANPNINFFPEFFPKVISSALDLAYTRYLSAVVSEMKGSYKDLRTIQNVMIGCQSIMFLLREAGAKINKHEPVPEYS